MAPTMLDTERVRSAALDAHTLEHFRAVLTEARALEAGLANERDEFADALAGQLDSDSILERELAARSANWARRAVDDIDDALSRMRAGSYGLCESCGRPIPVVRLEVLPHARTCVSCAANTASRAPR